MASQPVNSDAGVPGPLSAIGVVECGQGVAAAFAAKLLADLGADVIKIEPPGGDLTRRRGPYFDDHPDPERSGLFLYLNANKRGAVLDLEQSGGRDLLDALLDRADILIHNVRPPDRARRGLAAERLCARFPRLIVASISPFGERGPYANYRAYDVNLMHSSGFAAINPACSPYPDLPPAKLFGQQAEFQGGLHAAVVALAAWLERRRTGAGQAVDVSQQECIFAMLGSSPAFFTYAGSRTSRLGVRPIQPWMAAECADGKLYLACIEEQQWLGLLELLGNPQWGREEIFKDRTSRAKHFDALRPLLEEITRRHTVSELYHAAQKMRLPVAPLNRMSELYADRHLRARNFFVPLAEQHGAGRPIDVPGAPYKFSTMRWALRRRAPRLGEHDQEIRRIAAQPPAAQGPAAPAAHGGARPLSGIRVLDFSWVWGGPFCTLNLAQLGADVIRVESARRPCLFRRLLPFADNIPGLNRAGLFNQVNQGKRSIVIELDHPQGLEIARSLVRWADVVVENFAPGVIEKIGLSYQVLRAIKPDLIMLSISGFGQSGPLRNYVSYGGITGAYSGFYAHNGHANDEPRDLGATYADPAAGIFGAAAILLALVNRELSGAGQYIDLSMLEAMGTLAAEGLLEVAINGREPRRMANRDRWMAPHNCYKARGDAEMWVTIAAGSDAQWRALCGVIGRPDLAADPRYATAAARKHHEDQLDAIITQWTRERDRWDIAQRMQRAGVAAFPTLTNEDLFADRHLAERGFVIETDHPQAGRRKHTAQPWSASSNSQRALARAPMLGEHTAEILGSVLGYPPEQIARLKFDGAVA